MLGRVKMGILWGKEQQQSKARCRLRGQALPSSQHFITWAAKRRLGVCLGSPPLPGRGNLWSVYPKVELDSDPAHWWVNKILLASGGAERGGTAVTCHSLCFQSGLSAWHYRNLNLLWLGRELGLGCHQSSEERRQSKEKNLDSIGSWRDLVIVELPQDSSCPNSVSTSPRAPAGLKRDWYLQRAHCVLSCISFTTVSSTQGMVRIHCTLEIHSWHSGRFKRFNCIMETSELRPRPIWPKYPTVALNSSWLMSSEIHFTSWSSRNTHTYF